MNRNGKLATAIVALSALFSCGDTRSPLALLAADLPLSTGKDAYGDPLPKGAVARLGTLRFRHSDYAPRCIALSPTGECIASGAAGTDRSLRLWDAKDGKMIWRVDLIPVAVAFFPDGKHLVCAAEGEGSCIIEVASGRRIALGLVGGATSVAVSADGSRFAICSLSTIHIWRLTESPLCEPSKIDTSFGEAIAFSKDGSRIAAADRGRFTVWDVSTREKKAEWKTVAEPVRLIAFHNDDREIVSVIDGNRNSTVDVWDAKTGQHRSCRYSWFFSISSADLSKDGNHLALLTNRRGNEIVVLDLTDEKFKRIVHVPSRAQRVAWSGDGKSIATLSAGICNWDWKKDTMLHGYPEILPDVHSDRFEWNDRYFVTDQQVWDIRTGKIILSVNAPDTVGVKRDGTLFVVAKKNVMTPDGQPLLDQGQTLAGERQALFYSKSRRVFVTIVSETSPSARGRSELRVTDLNGEIPKIIEKGVSMDNGSALVKTGSRFLLTPNESRLGFLASASSVGLVDLTTGNVGYHAVDRDKFPGYPLRYLSVDASGQWLLAFCAGRDPRAVLWNVKQPESPGVISNLAIDGRAPIAGLPFADRTDDAVGFLYEVERDGEDFPVIRTFGPDQRVRDTWEIRDDEALASFLLSQHGELLAQLPRHEFVGLNGSRPDNGSVAAYFAYSQHPPVAVSHGGHLAAIADLDGTITIWERPSQCTMVTFQGENGRTTAIIFSPGDQVCLTVLRNGTAIVWDLEQVDFPNSGRLGRPEQLCQQLAGHDARAAWRAVCALTRHGNAAIPAIAAMRWPTRISTEQARILIAQLDGDQFEERQRAFQRLRDQLANVRSLVEAFDIAGASTEVKARIGELRTLDDLASAPPDVIAALRAVEALERMGTPASVKAATQLLNERSPNLDERVRRRLSAFVQRMNAP